MKKLLCWWFGCSPNYSEGPGCNYRYSDAVPCSRCGSHDTDYADRVGDTRHARFMNASVYYCFRKWFPEKCPDCGKRYGDHGDCVPF